MPCSRKASPGPIPDNQMVGDATAGSKNNFTFNSSGLLSTFYVKHDASRFGLLDQDPLCALRHDPQVLPVFDWLQEPGEVFQRQPRFWFTWK